MPFWAYLERLERLPIATAAGARPGPRERRLSSVRNTVGAVASCRRVSTAVGKARSWVRQCLVCKCLEACVGAVLAETRLVQVCVCVYIFVFVYRNMPSLPLAGNLLHWQPIEIFMME